MGFLPGWCGHGSYDEPKVFLDLLDAYVLSRHELLAPGAPSTPELAVQLDKPAPAHDGLVSDHAVHADRDRLPRGSDRTRHREPEE